MDKTCNKCACNKVCNHDVFGLENCGNFVPFNDVHRRKEEEKKFLILVFAMSRINDGFVWMPDLIRWYSNVFNIPTKRLYYWIEKWDKHEVIEYGTSINGIHFTSEFFMKGEYKDLIDTFLSVLKNLSIERVPAADVVEVVRCKSCKYFCPYEGEEHKGDCAELVGLESCVYEDDFCSYGERKDSNENGL